MRVGATRGIALALCVALFARAVEGSAQITCGNNSDGKIWVKRPVSFNPENIQCSKPASDNVCARSLDRFQFVEVAPGKVVIVCPSPYRLTGPNSDFVMYGQQRPRATGIWCSGSNRNDPTVQFTREIVESNQFRGDKLRLKCPDGNYLTVRERTVSGRGGIRTVHSLRCDGLSAQEAVVLEEINYRNP